jgi:hypothetical protein
MRWLARPVETLPPSPFLVRPFLLPPCHAPERGRERERRTDSMSRLKRLAQLSSDWQEWGRCGQVGVPNHFLHPAANLLGTPRLDLIRKCADVVSKPCDELSEIVDLDFGPLGRVGGARPAVVTCSCSRAQTKDQRPQWPPRIEGRGRVWGVGEPVSDTWADAASHGLRDEAWRTKERSHLSQSLKRACCLLQNLLHLRV